MDRASGMENGLSAMHVGRSSRRSSGRRGRRQRRRPPESTGQRRSPDRPHGGAGPSEVAEGRPACQRAARVLRCAPALRVTHRPSLRSASSYGPCGPAWTGASRPSTTRGRRAVRRFGDGAPDRRVGAGASRAPPSAGRCRGGVGAASGRLVPPGQRVSLPRFGRCKRRPHGPQAHCCRSRSTSIRTGQNNCRQAAKVIDAEHGVSPTNAPAVRASVMNSPR